jgi:hypothetical protein
MGNLGKILKDFWAHRRTAGLAVSSTPMHMAVLGVLESAEFALWTFSFANATATQPKES